STDKVDTEIPSPVAGTLLEILVQEDDTVEVGTELARIGSADEAGGAQGGQDEQPAEGAAAASERQAAQVPQEVTAAPQGAGPVEEPDAAGGQGEPTQQAAAPQEPAKVAGGGSAGGGDAQDVTLPALGESVTEGTVTRWLKQVGDTVEVDEPLLEISTDKVDTEIPSPVAGTVVEILAQEDDTVEVGAVLARVGSADAAGGAEQATADEAPQAE